MGMQSLAVFCGSKTGNDQLFLLHAQQLGRLLAQHGYQMVYGGGNKGLMGAVADAALAAGGRVTGIIPEHLRSFEHQHNGLTELQVVPDMHTRKRLMYELCDAAIILPGGFGTMDEMFEMLTWNQLAIHDKPVLVLNTAGFYSDLFQMMQVMHRDGFLYDPLHERVRIFDLPQAVIDYVNTLR
ncbi:MAG: TIGR00730 family Rossman fold protein [Chitinophagaceae bacterium]|jgi:hypothetical protein|nr:TIGR00730 family Rossman fold protein [Chitinophagaceae bacterium]